MMCSSRSSFSPVRPTVGGGLAQHVAALQDVADEGAAGGILGAGGRELQLAQFADVVQHAAGDDQVPVERRLQVGARVRVFVGQIHAGLGRRSARVPRNPPA